MLRVVLGIVLASLLGFGTFKAQALIRGPELLLDSPIDGDRLEGGFVEIAGTAPKESQLKINGKETYPDATGAFREKLLLPRGTSILSVTARDRFGEVVTERRSVVVP